MPTWKRWLRYGQAYLDRALRKGNDELDQREAELETRAADRPWLRTAGEVPTVDEVRARIEHDAAASRAAASGAAATTGPPAPPGAGGDGPADLAFDRAEEQRRADERLRKIRSELGLEVDGEGGPPEGQR